MLFKVLKTLKESARSLRLKYNYKLFKLESSLLRAARLSKDGIPEKCTIRTVTTPSGAVLPEPKKPRFGYLRVISAVSIGLFIGATISKNVANFLEENDLFVPSDDDDDD